jgi:hypothetical protein
MLFFLDPVLQFPDEVFPAQNVDQNKNLEILDLIAAREFVILVTFEVPLMRCDYRDNNIIFTDLLLFFRFLFFVMTRKEFYLN